MRRLIAAGLLSLGLFPCSSTAVECIEPKPCEDDELNRLNTTDCQTYHAFLARGSDSGYPGHLGSLIKQICNNFTASDPGTTCGYENIIYPANSTAWGPKAWCLSAAAGARAGQTQMKDYAERCPNAKLIVLGFSQGGSVALDVLGGGGGEVFECVQEDTPALDRETGAGKNIIAAAAFGSVRRSASQSYSTKSGSNYTGTAPRSAKQLAGLNQYASILRDYCNHGDPICAVGSEPVDVGQHMNYFDLYNDEVTDFVVRAARGEMVRTEEQIAAAEKEAEKEAQENKSEQAGVQRSEVEVAHLVNGVVLSSVVFGAAMLLL